LKNEKVQPILHTSYKLAAQLLTSNEENIDNIKMDIKQYRNKLYEIDKIIKMLTNEQNSKPICLSQYNNVNIPNLLDNLANNSYLR